MKLSHGLHSAVRSMCPLFTNSLSMTTADENRNIESTYKLMVAFFFKSRSISINPSETKKSKSNMF